MRIKTQGPAPAKMPNIPKKKSHLICVNDVEIEKVDFLVYPYIPIGKLTIVKGDPGVGKSFLTASLAAAISCGGHFAGSKLDQGNVLIYNTEDGIADTTKGRLLKQSADCRNVFARQEPLELDEKGLKQLAIDLNERKPKAIILDPIQSFLGQVDTNRANEVRGVLGRLMMLALEHKCAVLIVQHLKKGGDKAIYRGNGSIDFLAAARSAILVGANQKNKAERAFIHIKSNLAPLGPSQGFTVTDGALNWTGPSPLTEDDLLAGHSHSQSPSTSKLDDAKSFLATELMLGPMAFNELRNQAKDAGFSARTLERAKSALNIVSVKTGDQWTWKLPTPPNGQGRQHLHTGNLAALASLASLNGEKRGQ